MRFGVFYKNRGRVKIASFGNTSESQFINRYYFMEEKFLKLHIIKPLRKEKDKLKYHLFHLVPHFIQTLQ